ncbi:ferredoxin reductase [Umezawaea sp. Da 62-37]|uniref:ferredoxin reductase n=1 Tax=Umezawaea sp. Da 62-37 TaxID=3075927 RepID=UPI0028F6FBB6|nr:ferredoxin reductase [Umezawaea sp. Da 62-37]WNV86303.1 ferredoxin reductase [Umezawaea sp. Da 62-37]
MATTRTPVQLTRLRDRARRFVELATTPLVPGDFWEVIDPLRGGANPRGRIVAVRPETRDAATIAIRPGRGWKGHTAGQYVRLGVDVDGVRLWRSYSLTSPPRPDGVITITVKAHPGGVVSGHLVRQVRPGTVVHLDQAAGDFTLPLVRPAKALFVTAGSGITPVMGMLRDAAGSLADVVLVHSAPRPDAVIFGRELRGLAARGGLRLVERHTEVDGRLTPEALTELVPDLASRHTWACGPNELLDALQDTYDAAGHGDLLHTERFRPAVIAVGEGGTVSFADSGVTAESDGATPLLDTGESNGVLMPSGCRMGICFGCVIPLREGSVRDLRNGAVTTAAAGDDIRVQTCVSAAAGPCRLGI